ncbi:recombination protein RecR [Thalassolituus marinus]|uniref:Recombination protein RecR n=1 Tax=Thalassolituus marinus TaxID=671053 RepID=A0ABS7ZQG2_9GAMM|nr:recombination protein RecR [Thalassolituus marinus]MCA6062585.1 recombination protein RecR [Thalassolituus marinus]
MPQPSAYLNLMNAFDALPGVGPRAADRLAQFVIQDEAGGRLAEAIVKARSSLQLCERCFCLAMSPLCEQCLTPSDDAQLMVVVDLNTHQLLQDAGHHNLFVLHGLLSPSAGVGPGQLKLQALRQRVVDEQIQSVFLVFPGGVEADATEWFIADMLADVQVTRTDQQALIQGKGV